MLQVMLEPRPTPRTHGVIVVRVVALVAVRRGLELSGSGLGLGLGLGLGVGSGVGLGSGLGLGLGLGAGFGSPGCCRP